MKRDCSLSLICSGNKGADKLRDYHAPDLRLFRICENRFPHEAANSVEMLLICEIVHILRRNSSHRFTCVYRVYGPVSIGFFTVVKRLQTNRRTSLRIRQKLYTPYIIRIRGGGYKH